MVRSITLTAISLVVLVRSAAAWDCQLSLGNDHFNLESLDKVHSIERTVPTPPTNTRYTYSLSLCQPLPLSSAPKDEDCPEGTYLCNLVSNVKEGHDDYLISVIPIAREDGLNPTAAYVEGESTLAKGWTLNMGGGNYNEVDQSVQIDMVCDPNADKDTKPTYENYDAASGKLSLKWVTAAACSTDAGSPPPPPPTDGDKGDHKDDKTTPPPDEPEKKKDESMGFFSWFFTLCFLGLLAYFVVGCYRNYTEYGATGWDMVPNRDVWRDLPYIVADLFRGRGGSRSGYSSLG